MALNFLLSFFIVAAELPLDWYDKYTGGQVGGNASHRGPSCCSDRRGSRVARYVEMI